MRSPVPADDFFNFLIFAGTPGGFEGKAIN